MADLTSLINALAGPPVAYDRRLRIPIHINAALDANTSGTYQTDDKFKYTNPGRIDLSSRLQKAWQDGEESFPKKALKHEIIHGLQNDTFWHTGKPGWTPELNTPQNSLMSWFSAFLNPQTKLDNVKNKILKLSKEQLIKENGGTVSALDGAFINETSEWIPWLLTDTLPKGLDERFTKEEKELLKDHISKSFLEITKNKSRYAGRNLESIWK